MKRKKILFITPPYHCGVVEVAGHWIPLTFVYLAGAVRDAGFEPVIYDAMTKRHNFRQIQERIEQEKPDYVAMTAITSTVPDGLEVLRIAKKINPLTITVIGGVHPSFMFREVLEHEFVDYVVREEGEETLCYLLKCLEEKGDLRTVKGIAYRAGGDVAATLPRPFVKDLDSLRPAWDLIEWKDYRYFVIPDSRLGAVSTSRGCSHDCTFCSQQKFWQQTWRSRSPESVVSEIDHLYNTYGVNVFLITDEYPTSDAARWERILDLLIDKDLGIYLLMETRVEDIIRDRDILWKYRKAGVIHIYIGVEATNQETLDLIKKDVKVEAGVEALKVIHEHGMITETSFILGFPHETKQTVSTTLKLSKIYNPDFAHYLALAPWPYADMYREMEPYIVERDYRKYNLIDPVIKPENMTVKEIDWAIIDCYRSFYMGKLKELVTMQDEFKKKYLLASMKLIMNSSFIVDKLGSLGTIPPQVESLMKQITKEEKGSSEGKDSGKMSMVSRSVKIDAPVDRVFSYVTNPANWTRFVTSLISIKNLSSPLPEVGMTYDWVYRMLGINFHGKGLVTGFERNFRFSMEMRGAFPVRETYTVIQDGTHTRLTVKIEYRIPGRALGALANKLIIEKMNQREAEAILKKIQTICEA